MGASSSSSNTSSKTTSLITTNTATTSTAAATSSSSSSSSSVGTKTLSGVGNLIKLLPTGTVFLFQFVNPVLTNNGSCKTLNKTLEAVFIVFCAFSCCFASFTDSYTSSDGTTHYGVVTTTGIWPASDSDDLSKYKLRFGDFVHAFFSVIVFAVLSLLDSNTVRCFYPEFESGQKILLQVLPPVIGVIAGAVFMIFPNNRHGIGYPSSSTTTTTTVTNTA